MEVSDVISIFMAGFALGLIGAHRLNKWDRENEYERGKLDALWSIQSEIIRLGFASRFESAGHKTTDSKTGDQKPV
jgi:hypothetical protein